MKNFTLLLIAILSFSLNYAQNVHYPLFNYTQQTPSIPFKISFAKPFLFSIANSKTDGRFTNQPSSQLPLINMLGLTVWSNHAVNTFNYQNNITVVNIRDGDYLLEFLTVGVLNFLRWQ